MLGSRLNTARIGMYRIWVQCLAVGGKEMRWADMVQETGMGNGSSFWIRELGLGGF